jgi:hypothetical protein
MKFYKGVRHHDYHPPTSDAITVWVWNSGEQTGNPLFDVSVASKLKYYFEAKKTYDMPFDWGEKNYGFGATNLSASILADFLCLWCEENKGSRILPQELIFGFRDAIVCEFNWTEWYLSEDEIIDFLEEYREIQEEALENSRDEVDDMLDELTWNNNVPTETNLYDRDEYRGADS